MKPSSFQIDGRAAWRARLVPQPDVPLVDPGECAACGTFAAAGELLVAGVWLEPCPGEYAIPRRTEFVTHSRCWDAAIARDRNVRASGRWSPGRVLATVALAFVAGAITVHLLSRWLLELP